MTNDVRYSGPPRDPDEVIASIRADEEFMRQIRESIDEARRGIPGVPLRRLREREARAGRTA